jgi:hypothetical protein
VSADATPLDRAAFEERYALAADAMGALAGPDELDEAWDDYAAGRWDALLDDPTPENAVMANRLAGSIAELLDAPAPDDPAWCRRLAARVDQLAVVLRDVTKGPDPFVTSEDGHPWERWVAAPRRDYAEAMRHPSREGSDA